MDSLCLRSLSTHGLRWGPQGENEFRTNYSWHIKNSVVLNPLSSFFWGINSTRHDFAGGRILKWAWPWDDPRGFALEITRLGICDCTFELARSTGGKQILPPRRVIGCCFLKGATCTTCHVVHKASFVCVLRHIPVLQWICL